MRISTRQDLQKAVSECKSIFVYQFGGDRTRGFGADYLGFLNKLMACLQHGIGFRFGKVKHPQGFIVERGWTDYFLEFCDEVDAPMLEALNRGQFPYARKIPITKYVASAWLRLFSKPHAEFFMFDHLGDPWTLGPPIFDENEDFAEARKNLIDILWAYNEETALVVQALKRAIDLPSKYGAICIRRGDKFREFPYVELDKYAEQISVMPERPDTIFVATDDVSILPRAQEVMSDYQLVALAEKDMSGYDHAQFKSLPAIERKRRTMRFFAQLELMRHSMFFLGSKTTNVAWMVNAHRGGDGVFWVD